LGAIAGLVTTQVNFTATSQVSREVALGFGSLIMKKDTANPLIKFYFGLLLLEGLGALAFIFMIPTDPKNAWLLGYSKIRIGMGGGMLILNGVLAGLLTQAWRSEKWTQNISGSITKILTEYRWFIPNLILLVTGLIFGPYFYLLTTPYIELLLRLSPILLFVFVSLLQTWFLAMLLRPPKPKKTDEIQSEHLIRLKPRKVALILSAGIGILLLISLDFFLFDYLKQDSEFTELASKFYFDYEGNIPTYFSASLLITIALLAGFIARLKRQAKESFAFHWGVLALGFAYISLDEAAALHELSMQPLRSMSRHSGLQLPEIFYFAWLIVGIPVVITFGIAYLRFFLHLPPQIKPVFAIAFVFYVGGVVGLEMIGSKYLVTYVYDLSRLAAYPKYWVITTIEELLEFSGLIIFIYGLLEYIRIFYAGESFKIADS